MLHQLLLAVLLVFGSTGVRRAVGTRGSRAVQNHLEEGEPATASSTLDHYMARPTNPRFNDMTLLHFVQHYTMPKELGGDPSHRSKKVVVIIQAQDNEVPGGYNPVMLSAWRANVDMQYCVSRRRVIEYCAKYATKSEPRSKSLKDIFSSIVRTLSDDNTSLKAVQKLLINSVGERDFSAQETCQLLLQLPMFRAVDETIVPCSEHGWLSILCHKGCLRLQGLGVAKPTLLLAITSAQAVGS